MVKITPDFMAFRIAGSSTWAGDRQRVFSFVFEISGVFAPVWYAFRGPHRHRSQWWCASFDELSCYVYGMEDHALAGACDVREDGVRSSYTWNSTEDSAPHESPAPTDWRALEVFFEQDCVALLLPPPSQVRAAVSPGDAPCACLLPPQRHAVTTQCAGVVAHIEVDVRVMVYQS